MMEKRGHSQTAMQVLAFQHTHQTEDSLELTIDQATLLYPGQWVQFAGDAVGRVISVRYQTGSSEGRVTVRLLQGQPDWTTNAGLLGVLDDSERLAVLNQVVQPIQQPLALLTECGPLLTDWSRLGQLTLTHPATPAHLYRLFILLSLACQPLGPLLVLDTTGQTQDWSETGLSVYRLNTSDISAWHWSANEGITLLRLDTQSPIDVTNMVSQVCQAVAGYLSAPPPSGLAAIWLLATEEVVPLLPQLQQVLPLTLPWVLTPQRLSNNRSLSACNWLKLTRQASRSNPVWVLQGHLTEDVPLPLMAEDPSISVTSNIAFYDESLTQPQENPQNVAELPEKSGTWADDDASACPTGHDFSFNLEPLDTLLDWQIPVASSIPTPSDPASSLPIPSETSPVIDESYPSRVPAVNITPPSSSPSLGEGHDLINTTFDETFFAGKLPESAQETPSQSQGTELSEEASSQPPALDPELSVLTDAQEELPPQYTDKPMDSLNEAIPLTAPSETPSSELDAPVTASMDSAAFAVGDRVRHRTYGVGTVKKVVWLDPQHKVLHVWFERNGKRLLDPELSSLEKVEIKD